MADAASSCPSELCSDPNASGLVQLVVGAHAQQRQALVLAQVLRVSRELMSADGATLTDTPLMQAGIDSLAATEVASRLRELSGVALSPTLLFEEPTPRAVASHLLDLIAISSVSSGDDAPLRLPLLQPSLRPRRRPPPPPAPPPVPPSQPSPPPPPQQQ